MMGRTSNSFSSNSQLSTLNSQLKKLYPFESRYFDLDGLRYHYIDEQRPRNAVDREVLLMVHGNPTWSFYWRNLVTHFRDKYRVIAVDHIGCGLSDKPSESEYPFTLERRIDDLARLIESLDLRKVTLIGHDWGGAIGMGAACRLPDRFSRFVLMNTGAFLSTRCPLRIRVCRTPIFGRFAMQGLNAFSVAAVKMAVNNRKNMTREVKAGLLAPYDTWSHRLGVYRFVQDIPLSPRHPSYKTLADIENKLPLFREKPICLIWGMLDWCFSPEFLKRFLQFYPEADVHRLEQAHHLLVEDAPEDVIAAVEGFLRGKK